MKENILRQHQIKWHGQDKLTLHSAQNSRLSIERVCIHYMLHIAHSFQHWDSTLVVEDGEWAKGGGRGSSA